MKSYAPHPKRDPNNFWNVIKEGEQPKKEKFDYNKSNFQKELFNLINSYSKNNLSKTEVVESLEWVLGNTKMS